MDLPTSHARESLSCCPRICVTPTRNENWIIRKFLAAAKCWATHIIVADQKSTDGTLEELQATRGVEVVINDSTVYDEHQRQHLLLSRARQISGKRILIGLDADEAFSANSLKSKEWEKIEKAAPGTILRFRWINILPGFMTAWCPEQRVACGFVDDGSEHNGRRIHSPRVPRPPGAPVLDLEEIVVLHFQYVLWERMASKQRWYQAWEFYKHGIKGPLDIYRQYNHMSKGWPASEIISLKPEWLSDYEQRAIDFRSLQCEPVTWWDREVLAILREKGPEYFKRIAIWDVDWNSAARRAGLKETEFSDPRSVLEKAIHRALIWTQHRRHRWDVRAFERGLRILGW